MKVNKLDQKETLTQVCSCEYCELFKNSFFIDKKSGYFWVQQSVKDILRNICFKIPRTTSCKIQI